MKRRGNGEGSIYLEASSGRWVGAVSVNGQRRKVKGRTRDDVRKRLDELKRAVQDGRPVGDGNLTVAQLLALYEDKALGARDRSPSTVATQQWSFRLIREVLGTKRVRTLSVDDVERALKVGVERGLKRSSLVKVRSNFGQVLNFAERRGLTSRNVARLAELPADAPRPADGRAFTVEQARTFMRAAGGERLEALWLVMLGLGLRPGEATGLAWDAIDLDAGRVHVRRSLKVEDGRFVLDERLKTSRSRRTLDAPSFVLDALKAHRRRQAQERLAAGELWSTEWMSLVFTTNIGTPLHPSNVRRALAKVTEAASLGRWHPHELRHSAASILSASGVPLELVANVLGHDGIRMTALVYRHAITPSVSAGAAVMQDVLVRGSTA